MGGRKRKTGGSKSAVPPGKKAKTNVVAVVDAPVPNPEGPVGNGELESVPMDVDRLSVTDPVAAKQPRTRSTAVKKPVPPRDPHRVCQQGKGQHEVREVYTLPFGVHVNSNTSIWRESLYPFFDSAPTKKTSVPTGIASTYKKQTQGSRRNGTDKENPVLGGLQDKDAGGERPTTPRNQQFVKLVERSRPISIESDISESKNDLSVDATSQIQTPAPKSSSAKKQKSTTSLASSTPPSAIKATKKLNLPSWAEKNNTWKTTFVDTLYAVYFADTEPFANYRKGEKKFLATVQVCAELVYPNEEYTVTGHRDDEIYHAAYDRVNEKQGLIDRIADAEVKKYFVKAEFKNNPQRIKKFAIWGSSPDGFGICSNPTPRACKFKPGQPGYIQPGDVCLSEMMINVVSTLLKYSANSVKDFGHPVGLVALAATAITRAFKMYVATGMRDKQANHIGNFSESECGDVAVSYVNRMVLKSTDNH
ncbi:hypothetical protein PM082_022987 [Marasmius tenuissimus]|nr:hypothetical protein PM082_022968 [Marasmius tenuissimus]KAJ8095662.1 hypothetical protein PM082_022987 [Marasmius tenuissimus]